MSAYQNIGDKALFFPLCLSCLISYNLLSHPFCALTSILIRYQIKLDSDDVQYGGHGRLDHNTEFFTEPKPFNGRTNSMQVNSSLFFGGGEFNAAASQAWSALYYRAGVFIVKSVLVHSSSASSSSSSCHFASSLQHDCAFAPAKSLNQIISKMSSCIWKDVRCPYSMQLRRRSWLKNIQSTCGWWWDGFRNVLEK